MIGQFFTPEIVVQTMFHLAGIQPGQRLIDPSCGDGAFIRAAPTNCEVTGCELDTQYADTLHKLVARGEFIHGDGFLELASRWGAFDLAIGNPPFSAQANLETRAEILQCFDLGAGRRSQCLEVLFLELFLKLVHTSGRIAIILPDGPLSNRPFQYVRNWLLCRTHIEAIVSLPRGVFTGTSAKTSILIAQKLPLASKPCREPTALLICDESRPLRNLSLARWQMTEPAWRTTVLADTDDWRPEAHAEDHSTASADTVELGEVFDLRTGFALYGTRRELFTEPAPDRLLLIRAKNLAPTGGLRLNENCAFISRQGELHCEASVTHPGEILFVRVGAGCYGRTALVPPGLVAQADDWIHVLTPKARVDGEALVQWFNSDAGRASVRRLAKGVGTLSVSKASLSEMRIPARFVHDTMPGMLPPSGLMPPQTSADREGTAVWGVPTETVAAPSPP